VGIMQAFRPVDAGANADMPFLEEIALVAPAQKSVCLN
jgi:hypothetical protein